VYVYFPGEIPVACFFALSRGAYHSPKKTDPEISVKKPIGTVIFRKIRLEIIDYLQR